MREREREREIDRERDRQREREKKRERKKERERLIARFPELIYIAFVPDQPSSSARCSADAIKMSRGKTWIENAKNGIKAAGRMQAFSSEIFPGNDFSINVRSIY
jgi:hypothetical protein